MQREQGVNRKEQAVERVEAQTQNRSVCLVQGFESEVQYRLLGFYS